MEEESWKDKLKRKAAEAATGAANFVNSATQSPQKAAAMEQLRKDEAAARKKAKDEKDEANKEYWKKRGFDVDSEPVQKKAKGGLVRGHGCATRTKKCKIR